MPTVTRLTSNGVFQSLGGFDEVSLNSGSILFNGSNYLSTTNSSLLDVTGSFTLECWVYLSTSSTNGIFGKGGGAANWSTSNGHEYFLFYYGGAWYWQFNNSGSPQAITFSDSTPTNKWVHLAVGYNGTTTRFWVNGVSAGTSTVAYTLPTTRNLTITGNGSALDSPCTGYISNLRFVNGTDVYGVGNSIITPLTSPLAVIANTSLLLSTNSQNPFGDSSINNFTITKVSNPTFNTIGPFYYPANTSINLTNINNNPVLGSNTNIITSTTSNGVVMSSGGFDEISMSSGSLYFNGSTDYLSNTSSNICNFGTADFTMECWVYALASSSYNQFVGTATTSNGFGFGLLNSQIYATTISVGYNTGVTITFNTWNHIAWVRNSGTVTAYLNGVSIYSTSITTNFTETSVGIGAMPNGAYKANAYISNVMIVKGIAIYTANFTPPKMPLSSVANTSLLLNNFAAEPFVDNSGNNNIFTVTGTVTSNTLSPFANTQQKVLNTGTMMTKEYDEVTWNPPIVTNGLVLNLDAANLNSYSGTGSTWTDLSGYSINATLVGTPTFNTSPKSFAFASGKYASPGANDISLSAATFIVWIYPTQAQSAYAGLIFSRAGNGGATGSVNGLSYNSSGNTIGYNWNDNTSAYSWDSGLTIPLNEWSMVCITISPTLATAYLCKSSGITTATNSISHPAQTGNRFYLGTDPYNFSGRIFNGNYSVAIIYNRELSSTEVQQNFNALRSRYGI